MINVTLCLISTNKYDRFVQPLIDSAEKYFLTDCFIDVHLFTDKVENEYTCSERMKITKHQIPSYKFPEATMFRYEIMTSVVYDTEYFFYMDVDMLFVDYVKGIDVLHDLVAVYHPGFYVPKGGSWETREESNCFVAESRRNEYFAGGFQGGSYLYYLAMQNMSKWIREDLSNGITPVWHDESAWNKWVLTIGSNSKKLTPEFCMVEQMHLRKLWGIDGLSPKIIALEKNHEEIRK